MAFLVFSVIFPINNHPPAVFRHMIVKHKELAVRSLIFRFYRRKHPENIDFRGVFGYHIRNSYTITPDQQIRYNIFRKLKKDRAKV